MDELKPGTNTGITDAAPPIGGWVAGGETGAAPVILEPSGEYDIFLPDEEAQATWSPYVFDTSACVTFSALNCIECLLNRMRIRGLMPSTHEAFLVNEGYVNKQTNKVNLSDRATAKLSGTTKAGNSLGAVGESIRDLHGVAPEADWPFPIFTDEENQDGEKKWNRYYADVPQSVQKKMKRFLDYFKINYQWIVLNGNGNVRNYLPYGPSQIAASVCPPWNSTEGMPPIPACGCSTQHATMVYGTGPNSIYKDFDHYKSFRKTLAADYCIPYAVQYYIQAKDLTSQTFHYTFNVDLKAGMPDTPEVRNLQKALQTVRRADGSTYMKAGVFGPYGPQTISAVKLFQEDNGILGNGGINFGPQTRKIMNAKLNAM